MTTTVRKHPPYNRIAGYQIVAGKTNADMAAALGIGVRTYREKINGIRDFSAAELRALVEVLGRSADDLLGR